MLRNNEKDFVEEIVENKIKPDNVTVSVLFKYLARYYYDQCSDMTVTDYAHFLCDKIKEFNLSIVEYEEYNYYGYVRRVCDRMRKGDLRSKLIDIREVVLTQKEIECVQKAKGWQKQKLLFTLYVLAKLSVKPTGWINSSTREIFTLANIGMPLEDRDYALHELYQDELIEFRHGINRSGIRVTLYPDSEPVVAVRRFENLGNQYLAKYKDGWTICKVCGRMVRLNGDHDRSRKYCKKCAENVKNHPKLFENYNFF